MDSIFASARPPRGFGDSAHITEPRQTQQAKVLPVDSSALESASAVLQDQFNKDAQINPDLGETLSAREANSILFCCFI